MSEQKPLNGRYNIKKLIGKGSFGDVYLAVDLLTQKKVAVKQLKQSRTQLLRRDSNFRRQMQLMTALHHPNIVCMVEEFQLQDNVFIVTEYCSNGDLSRFMKEQKLTDEQLVNITRQIIQGIKYIHKQGYIHRDLKPDNIFIDQNFVAKVADFGLSKKYQQGIRNTQMYGTPMYAPPSFLEGSENYTQKCDIYSFGLTICMMLKNQHIYDGAKNLVMLQRMQRELTPELLKKKLEGVDQRFLVLIMKCLTYDQNQRKSIYELEEEFSQLFPEKAILELPRQNVQKILKRIENLNQTLEKPRKFLQIHSLLTKEHMEGTELAKFAYASVLNYMKELKKVSIEIPQIKSVLESANEVLKDLGRNLDEQHTKCTKVLTQLKGKIGFEPFILDSENILKSLLMNNPNEAKYLSMLKTR